MREITTGFTNEITADQLNWRLLYKAEFPSGDVRLWNGLGVLSYNGEDYTGSGNLLGHTGIQETQDLEANGVTYRLSGINSAILNIALTEESWGSKVTSWFAVLDSSGSIVPTPYQIFSGRIDAMNINDDGETSYVDIVCESDLIDFKTARETLRTSEFQKIDHPTDTFFDSVSTVQDRELTWGVGRTD